MVCKMLASKLLGVVGIFMMANYAVVNGRCLKAPTGGIPRCPPTWSQWQDKCYKVHDAKVKWEKGKQICVKLGGVIVVPQSNEELHHLFDVCGCHHYWIGCNDIKTEGTWVCLDGDDTIDVQDKRWANGKPDSLYGNEDCPVGYYYGWNDWDCDATYTIICQRPASPAL